MMMAQNSDYEAVLEVNQSFYKALAARDLALMERVWVKDHTAGCVHPGWIMLQGWEAIRQSWENVFDPEDQLDIKLLNVSAEVRGDVAWVTCVQQITYIKRDPVAVNISQSTNIFERRAGGDWLMTIHHASPIPPSFYQPEETNLQ
ncbi:MAG: YybH family protein [Deltaproteobacteria bacterium]